MTATARPGPDRPWLDPVRVGRRLGLWTLACTISAAPNFAIAFSEGYDAAGMATGVVLFILGLTAFTCTRGFERHLRRPHVRRTLYIGYGIRIAISLAFPLAVFVDLWPGVVTMAVAEQMGFGTAGFASALVHTVIQGTLMNLIVGVLLVLVYAGLRTFVRPPAGGVRCPHCGYDRRGADPDSRCPECGLRADEDMVPTSAVMPN